MLTTDDQPTDAHPTDQTTDRRVTVAQAAVLLGLSEDAVRSRLKRGTLGKEKDADGTVFVVLGANGRPGRPTTNGGRPTTGQTTDQSALALMQAHLDSLGEQLTYIRDQLDQEREANRENRRIIAGLVQRVPELEAPRNGHETATAEPDRAEPHPTTGGAQEAAEPRSWLRRWFGFE
jgi:hypothetical protein